MFDTNRNLTHELARIIGAEIINGEYTQTQYATTISEIAGKHKISTNIVREALKILYAKGLLNLSTRTGITATHRDQWNLFDTDVLGWALNSHSALAIFRELNEFRIAIEPEAARLAALNFNDAGKIKAIGNALQRIKKSSLGSNDLRDAEIDFHNAILLASNNPYFIQIQKLIKFSISLRYSLQDQSIKTMESLCSDFESVFSEIKAGNESNAFDTSIYLVKKISKLSLELISSDKKAVYFNS